MVRRGDEALSKRLIENGLAIQLPFSTLKYKDEEGATYQLEFSDETISWSCVGGPWAGECGSGSFCAAEIESNIVVIAWAMMDGESTTLIADMDAGTGSLCHVYGGRCHMLSVELER